MILSGSDASQIFHKLLRLAACGVIGFGVDFSLTYWLVSQYQMILLLANGVGFLAGAIIGMLITNQLNIRDSEDWLGGLKTLLIGLVLVQAFVWSSIFFGWIDFFLSKVLASAVVVSWNFGFNYQFEYRSDQTK